MRPKTPDQEWDIEVDLRTRGGEPLRLVYATNVEADNRGIIVDEVSAFIDERKVGYLKFELFPEASLTKFYPSGYVNYLAHFGGRTIFPEGHESADLKTADLATLQFFVDRFVIWKNWVPQIEVLSRADFEDWFAQHITKPKFFDAQQKKYKEFLEFRLNQAFVTYANTISPNRQMNEPSCARQGIGTALYIAAALELERQGMDLRASGMQSEQAAGLWAHLEKQGLVEQRGGHRFLPGRLVRERMGITLPSAAALSL